MQPKEAEVILVNEQDEPLGTMEKMEAHRCGVLHRAFSVFVFNSKGELLLQKRASNKYHCAGKWTNTCCSHPHPGETTETAAARRLQEEMGFQTPLMKIFAFTYKSELDNGLVEHEFDHVYAGFSDGPVMPNFEEVGDFCFKSLDDIEQSLEAHKHLYTPWFTLALPQVKAWLTGYQEEWETKTA
jgi:isopentenyl-diphosphate delta-isomerase